MLRRDPFQRGFRQLIEEGLFPHENAMHDQGGLEEERRLMYVAITRARKRLYLSYSQTRMLHGQTRFNPKSRFFDELPESALKWLTPKGRSFASGLGAGAGSGAGSGSRGGASNSGAVYARGDWARGTFPSKSGAPERFASPPVPPQRNASAQGLKSGRKVFHAKFGEGRVQMLEGTGDDARAQVNFARHGVKWLALSVAKLTPL